MLQIGKEYKLVVDMDDGIEVGEIFFVDNDGYVVCKRDRNYVLGTVSELEEYGLGDILEPAEVE